MVRETRVPVQHLLDLHRRGYTVDEIHDQYPTVPKVAIRKVLALAKRNGTIELVA